MLAERYRLSHRLYPYARSPDQDAFGAGAGAGAHHRVVVVGGGPVGMATALDLGLRGVPVLVLDDHEGVGEGSRAICVAKRTLEIAHRLGCAEPMLAKGVVWNLGKVFRGERMVYEFDLLPEDGHRFPAFINLQQPYVELFLVERIRAAAADGAPIEIRGANRVTGVAPGADGVRLEVATPDGPYALTADFVVAADGAGSPLRKMMGLGFEGRVFDDSFLIADVRMAADFPVERRFWFDPPFRSAGASALLHSQPDGVWRIDFQLGPDVDRAEELREGNVRARLDAMLGAVDYDIVWTSIYRFQCRRMASFRHGRVICVGDAAHQVSPFGARGANGGIQDAENLAWKLALVLAGDAPDALLDSYDAERIAAADENILASTRATDFITPKSPASRVLRDAVLDLAERHDFARPLVNSGRLSVPCVYDGSPLNTADALPGGPAGSRPGAPCPDAPLGNGFLLDRLANGFALLAIGCDGLALPGDLGAACVRVERDVSAALAARYLGAAERGIYLVRPDQHVAGRWAAWDEAAVRAALARATGRAAA